jgi:hypothetical protein
MGCAWKAFTPACKAWLIPVPKLRIGYKSSKDKYKVYYMQYWISGNAVLQAALSPFEQEAFFQTLYLLSTYCHVHVLSKKRKQILALLWQYGDKSCI